MVISIENRKIFPPCVLCIPQTGFPLELGIDAQSQKTRMVGLPEGQKSFTIDLTVYTKYWRVTDGRTNKHRTTAKTALCRD